LGGRFANLGYELGEVGIGVLKQVLASHLGSDYTPNHPDEKNQALVKQLITV